MMRLEVGDIVKTYTVGRELPHYGIVLSEEREDILGVDVCLVRFEDPPPWFGLKIRVREYGIHHLEKVSE
jgi:hypothetical protein